MDSENVWRMDGEWMEHLWKMDGKPWEKQLHATKIDESHGSKFMSRKNS
jgi:hypothetical protein